MATTPVEMPWDLNRERLILEGLSDDRTHGWDWLRFELDHPTHRPNEQELERIFRGAVILYQKLTREDLKTNVTFGECLEQAIIWERG